MRTDQQEVGNRARILRFATYLYAMQWIARPAPKEESTRTDRRREETQEELGRIDQ